VLSSGAPRAIAVSLMCEVVAVLRLTPLTEMSLRIR
jgi:hypothetical protein